MTTAPLDGRSNEPLLEVDDLRTYFDTPRGVVKAVDGVSLRVDRGKTLGIVGESGSGKTVLSRSIMNLLPKNNTIRSGAVRFEGRDLTTLKPKEMRAIVEGVNTVKRHTRASAKVAGGIVEQEAPIHISNLAHVDPQTGRPSRVGFRTLDDGRKVRFAKRSGEVIDR